jgi:hypothetical protein
MLYFILMTHVSHLYDTYFDLFHILWPIVEPIVDYMNMNKMKRNGHISNLNFSGIMDMFIFK